MRSADSQRTTYFQSRRKALALAETAEQAEYVRLQAEAVALATAWEEFQTLTDEAMAKQDGLERSGASLLDESQAPPVGASDVHHE